MINFFLTWFIQVPFQPEFVKYVVTIVEDSPTLNLQRVQRPRQR